MEDLLSSEIELSELRSSVNLIKLLSEVDDDYRTLEFRILEDDEYRRIQTGSIRILE